MDFLIATHNNKKKNELQRILEPLGISVFTADEKNINLREVEETGETFEENAFLKAVSGCEDSGMPCVADDSGLCVDALDGAPGIYSARFGGEHGNDAKNNEKLLELLKDVPPEKRTARFVSCVCCVFPDGRKLTVRGEVEGVIGYEPKGHNGFGYDPLFIVGDRTFAQRSDSEKDELSHRGNALRKLVEELPRYL
ncbi:MAG: RdgB/HAM1 family non-canonical purine NTP pyrophosphatase [Clostridiales bacterium]|nr:RdgB/HAM1 family non-canonical purine NTP pyrophosphatase [Clostridiales bacterium]